MARRRRITAPPSEKQLIVRGLWRYRGAIAALKGIAYDAQSGALRDIALPESCLVAVLGAASLLESSLPEFSKYINVNKRGEEER